MTELDTYALKAAAAPEVAAPELPYRPPMPKAWRPRVALVGAGGIAAAHLGAYRAAGFEVAVIASRTLSRAEARRDEYFPGAEATDDIARTLARDDIEVVDITPHPEVRLPMLEAALAAGKHVLSQKPFVVDLDAGARLCDLAEAQGVRLAVNQNGRWAPHLAWMREAVRAGLVGAVHAVEVAIHWDHGWIAGTPYDGIDDLILYDFAIHWFDFLASLGIRPTAVHAARARATGQTVASPLVAQAMVAFEGGLATLAFEGRRLRPHLHRRQRRHPGQRRAGPRHPGRQPRHRRGDRPPGARRHLVPRGLRRDHGRAARRHRGRPRAAQRRPRQPRRPRALLRRHRRVRPRRPGGARNGAEPRRGTRLRAAIQ
jgi:predicted dehydrogenase